MLNKCFLFQRKNCSPVEGNVNSCSEAAVPDTDCPTASSTATTTAHSKVTAAPGANNPQPQGKQKSNDHFFSIYFIQKFSTTIVLTTYLLSTIRRFLKSESFYSSLFYSKIRNIYLIYTLSIRIGERKQIKNVYI